MRQIHFAHLAKPTLMLQTPCGSETRQQREYDMAGGTVPHFQNDAGHPAIEIGVKEFMCVGASPPFDHPHVFLDMGDATEIICPYCSTLFRVDASLDAHAARPPECALTETAAA
jgi:uncharacterized Zn-finger protein